MQSRQDLGCVVYSLTNDGIQATWIYKKQGAVEQGSGLGIRRSKLDKSRPFVGQYKISYFNDGKGESLSLDLKISYKRHHYDLEWKSGGICTEIGIGIRNGDQLIAAYSELLPSVAEE